MLERFYKTEQLGLQLIFSSYLFMSNADLKSELRHSRIQSSRFSQPSMDRRNYMGTRGDQLPDFWIGENKLFVPNFWQFWVAKMQYCEYCSTEVPQLLNRGCAPATMKINMFHPKCDKATFRWQCHKITHYNNLVQFFCTIYVVQDVDECVVLQAHENDVLFSPSSIKW